MNCRKQLGSCAKGDGYSVPKEPVSAQKFLSNVHVRAYAEDIFAFFERLPNSPNATIDSYKSYMTKIINFLIPSAPEKVVTQNVGADTILFLKEGISFSQFFTCLINYAALVVESIKVQSFVDCFFRILQMLNDKAVREHVPTELARPPHKLPLSYWQALVNAVGDIRPCYIIQGVNTQRTKLFEKVLAKATGALLLDIPTLIQWRLRPASVEEARKKLLKGGYLKFDESKELILECARSKAAQYRGWIIPASFPKKMDFSELFDSYAEFEQRCFCVELNASLEDLLDISKSRKFDPEDERIITTLPDSLVAFVQRLKRREFIGRELDEAVEEEEEEQQENEDEEEDEVEVYQLYKPPEYESPEERGDETQHLEEEDEGKKRLLTLPEESVEQIEKRFQEYQEEKKEFQFPNTTKRIVIDATESLNEMSNIVCDKTSVLVPCHYPEPVVVNEEEEQEEPKYGPVGENCVVSLVDEKRTVKGQPEHSVKFYGYTFTFETKEKLEKFVADPKKYMLEVFHTYHHRILIVGGRMTGKKEMAKRLSEYFDTEIVDFETLIDETRKRIPPKEDEEEEKPEKPGEEEEKKEKTGEEEEEKKENNGEEEEKKEEPAEEAQVSIELGEDNKEEEDKKEKHSGEEDGEEKPNAEEDQKEKTEEEDAEGEKTKKKPKKKREIPPPIYTDGYISIVPKLDPQVLRVFTENEAMAPEIILVLKLSGENLTPVVEKRLGSHLLSSNIDSSAAELMVGRIVRGLPKWDEKLNEFIGQVGEMNLQTQVIDATLPVDEVFWNCAYAIDPLLPRCSEPSEEEPKFGYMGPYCPVTLKEKHLLQNGSETTLYYDGSLFGFADETAQERFRNAPLAFIGALPLVPPPRILILGTRGSGKTSIATEIGRLHNTPVFEIPANPKFEPVNEEEEEPDQEEVTRKTMEPFLQHILEVTKNQTLGWIIEGTPSNSVGASMMLDLGLKPDFVMELEQSEQWVLMRNRRRLDDDEQILNEESEAGAIVKEFSATVAEATPKGEPVTIDTSRRFTSTMDIINRVLQRELAMRKSLFLSESSTPVDDEGGEEDEIGAVPKGMLKSGQAFISQFGRYCPVCLHETGSLVLTDLKLSCTFLGRLFFFETEKHRQKFMDDPLTYVLQLHPPAFPFVPKVSVLGNPDLAARLATSLNAELIRPRDVIARVARHHTTFGAHVRKILATGKAVDATIFRTALCAVLSRHDCQVRGYVLDGYPTKLSELMSMREDGFMPSDLVATKKADEEMIRYAIENFHNVVEITDEPTVWMMTINATNKLTYNMRQRWQSLLAMDEKRAYCVSALDVSPEEVAANLSDYGHYCPVTYVADQVSVSSQVASWDNIVKYGGKFYHPLTTEYRNAFLISPIPFVHQWADAPVMFATQKPEEGLTPEIEGYDVIELSAGNFVQGDDKYVAVYDRKLFRFANEENLRTFCENAWRYKNVPLPAHRPVAQPPTLYDVSAMPTVPFLEQSVGDVITECIVELTKKRPKIPGKTMTQSMNEYIAAYIRAHSKDIGDLLHERFVKQMEEMEESVALAEKLKASLETPFEMRDEAEHERLCQLWSEKHQR